MSEYCILISLRIIQTRHYVWQPIPPFFFYTKSCFLPVVVGQFDVVSGCQDFAVLQPDKVRFGDALGHTAEHSTAPCCFGHRLRPLQELWGSWRGDRARQSRGLSVWTRKITSSAHQVLPWQRRYLYLQIYVLCGGLQIHTKEDESIYKIDDITWIFCTVQPTEIQSNTCLLKPKTEWHYWIITLWHIALYFTAGH